MGRARARPVGSRRHASETASKTQSAEPVQIPKKGDSSSESKQEASEEEVDVDRLLKENFPERDFEDIHLVNVELQLASDEDETVVRSEVKGIKLEQDGSRDSYVLGVTSLQNFELPGSANAGPSRKFNQNSDKDNAYNTASIEVEDTKADNNLENSQAIRLLKDIVFNFEWVAARRKRYGRVTLVLAWIGLYLTLLLQQQPDYLSLYHTSSALRSTFPSDIDVEESTVVKLSKPQAVSDWAKSTIQTIWQPLSCGDGRCDSPFERKQFPAPGFSSLCQVDCGLELQLYTITVLLAMDFTKSPFGASAAEQMRASASWNLCLLDTGRADAGLTDECWHSSGQRFKMVEGDIVKEYNVIAGKWYIEIQGDYYSLVKGKVLDPSNVTDPVELAMTPIWRSCADEVLPTYSQSQSSVPRLEHSPISVPRTFCYVALVARFLPFRVLCGRNFH
ncbi:hypothetical protein CYMTET_15953 [Cymbomonas tetramitiformis]|uniref:Uncharacterized protein n=1 Tax=Cymbomonas tetramitiformis TaxID=36881 RepID=A0AAE0GD62_9CHLO|nr:hypothetical protein CYMTET_15953 [Cymbomonas tetramitiformis]